MPAGKLHPRRAYQVTLLPELCHCCPYILSLTLEILVKKKKIPHFVLMSLYLITRAVQYPFQILAICIDFSENCLFMFLVHYPVFFVCVSGFVFLLY